MTLEELKVIIEAETKGLRNELKKIKEQTKSVTSSIQNETGKIKSAFGGLGKFVAGLAIGTALIKIGKDAVKMAMSVEASIQQVDRLMGKSAAGFKQWAKNNALAFNMSQSDALRFGAVYSNLLTSFLDTSEDVTGGTQALLKASAVVASGTGRSMEDVMERIRSGLLGNTEAIEDLGVDVRVGMLESTEAFKRFAGDRSWDQLDTKTQQQIRLFGILEQASTKFGDEVLQNSNSSLQQFVAVLKDIQLNLGNAFMPIVNVVMPILTGLAMKLREATSWFATFMQLLFGKKIKTNPLAQSSKETSNALGNATSNANGLASSLGKAEGNAKKTAKAMGSLAAFDDLNILSASDSSGGGGSSGGSGGGSSGGGFDWGEDENTAIPEIDTSGIQKSVDKVKKMFGDMKKFIVDNKAPIISALAGIVAGFTAFNVITKLIPGISAFIKGIQPLNVFFGSWLASGGGVVNFFSILGAGISAVITPAVVMATVIASITAALVYLYQTSEQFRDIVNEAFNSFMEIVSNLYNNILVPLFTLLSDIFMTILVPIAVFLTDVFVTVVDLVASVLLSIWNNVLAPITNFLVTVFSIALKGVIEIWNSWKPGIEMIMGIINGVWENCLKPFVDFIKNTFIAIFETFGAVIDELMPHVEEMFQGLVDFFVGVFTLDVEKIWEGIQAIFKGFSDFLDKIFKKNWSESLGALGNILDGLSATLSGIWDGIKKTFNGVITFVKGVFSGDWKSAWNGVVDIFTGIFKTIGGVVKAPINAVIGIVNGAIDKINGFGFEVPDWVPFIGGKKFKVDVPKLKYLQHGGIVNSATPAIIGEYGKEVVMPLERNTGWITKLAETTVSRMPMPVVENSGGQYVINLILENGEILARYVIDNIKDYERRTGDPVFSY